MKSKFRKRRALSVSLSSLAVLSLCLSVSLSWAASARRVSLSRVAVLLYDASLLFVRASTAVIGDATLPPRVGPRRGSSTCSTPSKLSDGSTLPLAPHADYTHTHTHTQQSIKYGKAPSLPARFYYRILFDTAAAAALFCHPSNEQSFELSADKHVDNAPLDDSRSIARAVRPHDAFWLLFIGY